MSHLIGILLQALNSKTNFHHVCVSVFRLTLTDSRESIAKRVGWLT